MSDVCHILSFTYYGTKYRRLVCTGIAVFRLTVYYNLEFLVLRITDGRTAARKAGGTTAGLLVAV